MLEINVENLSGLSLTPAAARAPAGPIVQNGDFSTSDPLDGTVAWSPLDFSGGAADCDATGGHLAIVTAGALLVGIQQNVTLSVGVEYRITLDVIVEAEGNAAGAGIAIAGTGGIPSTTRTTTGQIDQTFTATLAEAKLQVRSRANSPTQHNVKADNITIEAT